MTRNEAVKICREELDKNNLQKWHIRLNTDSNSRFLGLCSHADLCIILSAHHIDIHPDPDIINTIKHEVAHAIVGPGHAHNDVWKAKAREIGCDNTAPCSNLSLSPDIIDAIRSGAQVEISFEEEIIRRPKYEITRLQDKCPDCGKVAKTKTEIYLENKDPFKPDEKFIYLECGHLIVKKIPKGTPFQTIVTYASKVKDCKHEWDKHQCLNCREYRPMDFQLEGMRFIEAALAVNRGGALFDQQGLGKTPQGLGVIKFHPELWPVLYVVKSAVKFQWFKQIMRWCGDEFVAQIIASSNDIIIPGLKSYIISYDMLVPKTRKSKNGKTIQQGFDISKFENIIKLVVLDECQHIKNPDSSRTQQVRRIVKDKQVIAMSGTPWKNRGSEFFSVLNMLDPVKFNSYEGFIRNWVAIEWNGNKSKQAGIKNIPAFKEHIKDIAIRRERHEVLTELARVNRNKFYIQLDDLTQNTYESEVSAFVKWYNNFVISGEEDTINNMALIAKLNRLRHIVGLAKIPATVEFALDFIDQNERSLVIGVQHIDVGVLLYDQLTKELPDVQVLKLTGSMNALEKYEVVAKFNSKLSILVTSTLAGGEGVDGLQDTCNDIVLHERQWNPQNEEQLEDRLCRIGQDANSVNATYVEAELSVDTQLDAIVENKRIFFHQTMNKGETPKWNQNDIIKELAASIVAKFKERNKGKEKVKSFTEMVQM